MKHTCRNCHEAPPFDGFDECLECAVAIEIHDNPGYLEFAKRVGVFTTAQLAKFEREWSRQASALIECGMMVAA